MKLNTSQYGFVKKVLKNLKTHHHDNKAEIKSSSKPVPDIEKAEIQYNKEDKRVLGTTDYKKFEAISKEVEKLDVKEESKDTAEDKLKMGCSNDLRKERQLYDKPTDEKIEATKLFKSEGDYYLKKKDYDNAFKSYEKGLLQLFYTFEDTPEQEKEVEKLKVALNLNISIIKINEEKYKDSIGYLNEALKLEDKNLKAVYRLAYVNFKLEEFEEARSLINKAKSIIQNDQTQKESLELFNQLSISIDEKENFNNQKSEDLFKKMLAKK